MVLWRVLHAIEFGKSFDLTIRAVENEINNNSDGTGFLAGLSLCLQNSSYLEKDDVSIDSLLLGNGDWWYVGLLVLAGLVVGLVKVIWNLLGAVWYLTICSKDFQQNCQDLSKNYMIFSVMISLWPFQFLSRLHYPRV